jgi:hypothetical protein
VVDVDCRGIRSQVPAKLVFCCTPTGLTLGSPFTHTTVYHETAGLPSRTGLFSAM